jgi:hypothetical protein
MSKDIWKPIQVNLVPGLDEVRHVGDTQAYKLGHIPYAGYFSVPCHWHLQQPK